MSRPLKRRLISRFLMQKTAFSRSTTMPRTGRSELLLFLAQGGQRCGARGLVGRTISCHNRDRDYRCCTAKEGTRVEGVRIFEAQQVCSLVQFQHRVGQVVPCHLMTCFIQHSLEARTRFLQTALQGSRLMWSACFPCFPLSVISTACPGS